MSPSAAFYENIWVVVDDGVYEPADDTFMLCDNLDVTQGKSLLEIGTGCGLVAIVAAKAGLQVVATDQSAVAVQNAKKNVVLHKCTNRIEVRQGDLFEPIRSEEKFDVLAFNPPYLPGTKKDPAFDPVWSGGKKGSEVTERFLEHCTRFLRANGRLLLVQSSLSDSDHTKLRLEQLFQAVDVKEERAFFFERLILFEARIPR